MNTKLILLLIFLSTYLFSQELITLKTRDGIKQRFLLNETSANAKAVAILFSGGSGKLNFYKDKNDWNLGNFLIRSRELFNQNDIITLSVDSPSKQKEGLANGFRTSKEHLEDISFVINYAKKNYPNLPLWLIGTSRGTVSAAYNAINQENINGLVLTSSLSIESKNTKPVTNLELDKLIIPTLLVQHEEDKCRVTPPSGAKEIFDKLTNVKSKDLKFFTGGETKGKDCGPNSYHGFLGIEEEVVKYISDWIKSH